MTHREIPKVHHFVPESYLVRFTDQAGFLHIHDLISNQWRRERPANVMREGYYYRQEWAPPGVDPFIFEKRIGDLLETPSRIIIDKFINDPHVLSEEDLSTFLLYLELQRIRVPRQIESAKTFMRDLIMNLGPTEVAAEIRSGSLRLRMHKSANFEYMRNVFGQSVPWFAQMEWEVICAQAGAAFITTDSPVSFYNSRCVPPIEPGIGLAGTMVLFPLSSTHLLIMRHPQYNKNLMSAVEVLPDPPLQIDTLMAITKGQTWSPTAVANHNKVMAHLAERWVVGQSSEVVRETER